MGRVVFAFGVRDIVALVLLAIALVILVFCGIVIVIDVIKDKLEKAQKKYWGKEDDE